MYRLTRPSHSFFVSIVGSTFLVDKLYGCKYSPHIGTCNLPYVYVKTVLFCVSGRGLHNLEREYLNGLIGSLIPIVVSHDEQTKLELMQFVDTVLSCGSVDDSRTDSDTVTPDSRVAPTAMAPSPIVRGGHPAGGPPLPDAVTSLLSGALLPTSMARVLLYDAVSTCVADGEYDATEKERVAIVAAKLGVAQRVREIIETMAIEEQKLAMVKRRLLMLGDTTI